MKITRHLVPSLLAGSFLFGGASGAFAAPKAAAPHRTFAYGQISNLSTAGFTLTRAPKAGSTAAPKVVSVLLGATTKEKARKGTTGTLTNGEYAFVVGAGETSGISATRILYSTTGFKTRSLIERFRAQQLANRIARNLLRRHVAAGLVNGTATTATSVSITTAKGKTLVFAITTTTKYRVNRVLAKTPPTLTNGEKVRVTFTRNATTKILTARVITVIAAS